MGGLIANLPALYDLIDLDEDVDGCTCGYLAVYADIKRICETSLSVVSQASEGMHCTPDWGGSWRR